MFSDLNDVWRNTGSMSDDESKQRRVWQDEHNHCRPMCPGRVSIHYQTEPEVVGQEGWHAVTAIRATPSAECNECDWARSLYGLPAGLHKESKADFE